MKLGWFYSAAAVLAVACGSQLPQDDVDSGAKPDVSTGNPDASKDATAGLDADLADSGGNKDGSVFDASTDVASVDDAQPADSSSDGTIASDASGDGPNDAAFSDVVFSFDAGKTDGGLTADAACVQKTATATAVPLDMYVLFDRSGSMDANLLLGGLGDCDVGGTPIATSKWCYAVNALGDYFNSSDASGNAAALQYFPINAGQCNGNGYASPASPSTGFRSLPTTGFNSSLNGQAPQGADTPIEGALRGITSFTSNASNQRAGRKLIGILITDGNPEGSCNNTISSLKSILSAHYASTNIPTFIIGMTGATFSNLETIAEGGGAPVHNDKIGTLTNACGTSASTCRHWNVNDGNGNALTEALKQIQKSAVACDYAMPTTDAGIVDPNQVKVEYRAGGTGTPQTFNKVASLANCTSAGGFYYDNNSSPKSLTLCPTTCTTVQADSKAKVDILLGCLGS